MGTDSTAGLKQGAPVVPMSRLLRVGIGRDSLFLIFRLFIAISSHLFTHFAHIRTCLAFSLLLRRILSCFHNNSSSAVPGKRSGSHSILFNRPILFSELKMLMRSAFCNPTSLQMGPSQSVPKNHKVGVFGLRS